MNDLRPTKLDGVIGQKRVKECLQISIKAAQKKGEALPHILFNGPPGVGKTTLALAIANEMGVSIQIANGANCRQVKNIVPYLINAGHNSILFIDEIHRMTTLVDEILYPAMEDFRMDVEKDGITTSTPLEKFTLIGATTDGGSLSPPLYDRFQLKHSLTVYEPEQLSQLIKINAPKLKVSINDDAAEDLGKRSRGTPRVANNLVRWTADYCTANDISTVCIKTVKEAMDMLDVDENGLDAQDRRYLLALNIVGKKGLKPVGLNTLIAATNINEDTITQQIEPFLLRQGIIMKTPKGRKSL